MKLAITQLLGLAANAGFSGSDLQTAVAIALAESGGDPSAYNPERAAGAVEGHGSFGLWQIYLNAHPEFAGLNLIDPQTNAGAAYSVYASAGNSFRPWSTFKNGAYLTNMDAVGQVLAAMATSQDSAAPSADAGVTDGGGDPGIAGGAGPNGGELLAMFVVGGLLLWVFSRSFG